MTNNKKPSSFRDILLITSGAIGVHISVGIKNKLTIDCQNIRCSLDLTKEIKNQNKEVLKQLYKLLKI